MTIPKVPSVLPVLLIAVLMGAGHAGPTRSRPVPEVSPVISPASSGTSDLGMVHVLAATFMTQFRRADYAAQWQELAPVAQNQWPSQQSRDQMLAAKFTGAATVSSFTLGAVRSGARWTSPEDPDASVTGAYAVPVELGFADPGAMQPVEVSTDYQAARPGIARTQIWVAPQTLRDGAVGWALLVVGEGPASLDAPIINPASPTTYAASVPILMYHLVGPPPVRNDHTSEYSYHLDYELTVPPAQFQAEVSYLVERGYASISLTRLFDHLDYGLPLPAETVVLTFDDGFINEYQDAVPVLKAAGYTGVFFPCSGLIGVTNARSST